MEDGKKGGKITRRTVRLHKKRREPRSRKPRGPESLRKRLRPRVVRTGAEKKNTKQEKAGASHKRAGQEGGKVSPKKRIAQVANRESRGGVRGGRDLGSRNPGQ